MEDYWAVIKNANYFHSVYFRLNKMKNMLCFHNIESKEKMCLVYETF